MKITEDGIIRISDDVLNKAGDTYMNSEFLKNIYKSFEKFLKTIIEVQTKRT